MHILIKITIAFAISATIPLTTHNPPQPATETPTPTTTTRPATPTTTTTTPIRYQHGNCDWLKPLALQAGWQPDQITQLTQIALRESGCCPNRAGGDQVDRNCNITGVNDWTHRSDSGLLQINGVHWKQDHKQYHGLICKKMYICTQQPLLDPLTNLRAGKLLYDVAGWTPWGIQTKP